MTVPTDAHQRIAQAAAERQGLPPQITDLASLRRVAVLVDADPRQPRRSGR